ncbi:hypothetical protein PR048_003222 [Dryococelus australis]|uniref:Uncharacterized protein n=1 Tax=Dryococelus australis TaxID=614101 RepID=A0ABQ9IMI8_9NEOP|nr:hypothetical protein PR048_003222 [Dryococelus australis]
MKRGLMENKHYESRKVYNFANEGGGGGGRKKFPSALNVRHANMIRRARQQLTLACVATRLKNTNAPGPALNLATDFPPVKESHRYTLHNTANQFRALCLVAMVRLTSVTVSPLSTPRFSASNPGNRSSAGMHGQRKLETPEKTRRPAASSDTIPTCENPGIEPARRALIGDEGRTRAPGARRGVTGQWGMRCSTHRPPDGAAAGRLLTRGGIESGQAFIVRTDAEIRRYSSRHTPPSFARPIRGKANSAQWGRRRPEITQMTGHILDRAPISQAGQAAGGHTSVPPPTSFTTLPFFPTPLTVRTNTEPVLHGLFSHSRETPPPPQTPVQTTPHSFQKVLPLARSALHDSSSRRRRDEEAPLSERTPAPTRCVPATTNHPSTKDYVPRCYVIPTIYNTGTRLQPRHQGCQCLKDPPPPLVKHTLLSLVENHSCLPVACGEVLQGLRDSRGKGYSLPTSFSGTSRGANLISRLASPLASTNYRPLRFQFRNKCPRRREETRCCVLHLAHDAVSRRKRRWLGTSRMRVSHPLNRAAPLAAKAATSASRDPLCISPDGRPSAIFGSAHVARCGAEVINRAEVGCINYHSNEHRTPESVGPTNLRTFLNNSNKLQADSASGSQREPITMHYVNPHTWRGAKSVLGCEDRLRHGRRLSRGEARQGARRPTSGRRVQSARPVSEKRRLVSSLRVPPTNARFHHRESKLDPRSDIRSTQKTVALFDIRTGLEIEMKLISNRRN